MFYRYLFPLISFFWGLAGTSVSIALAKKFRLVDVPGGRKKHSGIMPRGAGIVLWSGYLLWALFVGNMGVEVPFIATGASLIFIVGYMDDMHPLPPLLRLCFQLCAAVCASYALPLPLWQRLLFVFWITGMTNAYNLVDGMDGLCLTLSLITVLAAFSAGGSPVWLMLGALIFGVLLWNFPFPKTFLGDGGSTLLGFVCASHFAWNFFPDFFGRSLVNSCMCLFLAGGAPVIDTLSVMTRRIISKKSPFLPDRKHAHHKLQDAGLSKFCTLFVLAAIHFAILCAGFSLLGIRLFPRVY